MVSQTEERIAARAPVDAEALERALRPFGASRMLPREAYTSEAVFDWEREHFFDDGWTCVGPSSAVAKSGDQRAETVGDGGVFLIRGDDGVVRAFANACRHRGHELLPCGAGTVNRSVVVCPYHAWTYRLDGALRKAPGFERGGFEPAAHGLVELASAEWHGLVFVNPSGRAGEFSTHVEGLEEVLAPYELERLVTKGHHDYVVAANWKVLTENYQECYHCPAIHPELCAASPPRSGENYHHPGGAWVGGWMRIRDGYQTMSLDGSSGASLLRGIGESRRRVVDYLAVFPNVLVSLHPDYVMTHVLTPLAADRTRIVCEWHFAPEDADREGFDASFAVDFWDVTNRQDWLACESVQRGLSSPHAVPGPLSEEEDGVYQFVTMVAAAYAGGLPRPGATGSERRPPTSGRVEEAEAARGRPAG
ncbi:MAG TPA: aromatic ring-hydroxylating dioxygenase subunit alpha [Acidimicrobiales bacterium]|nr:aromatic ring-hydroxylating dioxygenase subunit alpha [Acidimicrobiales bacterium]